MALVRTPQIGTNVHVFQTGQEKTVTQKVARMRTLMIAIIGQNKENAARAQNTWENTVEMPVGFVKTRIN